MHSAAVVSDRATSLSGLAPCQFPGFSRPAQHPGRGVARRPIASVRVTVEQADKLLGLSVTDPDGLAAALRTAWALLLRCYTGQDDVNFGFQRGGNRDGDDTDELLLARFVLDDSSSLEGIVGRTKVELAGQLRPVSHGLVDRVFHTAVVLWDFTKTPVPCNVLPPVTLLALPDLFLLPTDIIK